MIIDNFYEYGIYVIPINGKKPFTNEWNDLPESFWEEKKYKPTGNYGLICGKKSNIIALDLDVIDQELQKKVMKIINPSPIARYGSKKKLPTYFYQYEEKYSRKITIPVGPQINGKNQAVEILTNGQQCMIPPSIHPDGYACEWVGLPLVSADELPLLDESIFPELAKLYQNHKYIPNSLEEGSRNNTLGKYIRAKIYDGKSPNECILEILEQSKNSDKPLFADKSEKSNINNELANATRFFFSQYSSLLRLGDLPDWRESKAVAIIDKPIPSYKQVKFPKFRGLAQDIFRYIYDSSPVPRSRLAMASTLAFLSTLFGNRCSINGFLPNLYCMIVSPSGYGKNNPMKAPANLFHALGQTKLVGESPASDSAIIYELPTNRIRLDIIDEASRIFAGSDDSKNYMAGRIADVYADLYTSAGSFFMGKKAISYKKDNDDSLTIGSCHSPHVSILAAMTVEDFQSNFSERLMGKGLGGRFLFFVDDEMKKPSKPKIFQIPNDLLQKIKLEIDKMPIYLTKDCEANIPMLPITPKAQKALDEYLDYLFTIQKEDSKTRAVSQRFSAIFHKMILIDTLSLGHNEIKECSVEWARAWCDSYLSYLPRFFEQNLYASNADRVEQSIENFFFNKKDGATKTELCKAPELRRLNILTKQRNEIIKSLIASEVLVQKDGKIYHSVFTKILGI